MPEDCVDNSDRKLCVNKTAGPIVSSEVLWVGEGGLTLVKTSLQQMDLISSCVSTQHLQVYWVVLITGPTVS